MVSIVNLLTTVAEFRVSRSRRQVTSIEMKNLIPMVLKVSLVGFGAEKQIKLVSVPTSSLPVPRLLYYLQP